MAQENQQPTPEPRPCPLARGKCLESGCRFWDSVTVKTAGILGVTKVEESYMCRFDSLLIAAKGMQSGFEMLVRALIESGTIKAQRITFPKN